MVIIAAPALPDRFGACERCLWKAMVNAYPSDLIGKLRVRLPSRRFKRDFPSVARAL